MKGERGYGKWKEVAETERRREKENIGRCNKIKKDIGRKKRAILKEEEKLGEDFEVAQRTLTDASACLQKAIVEND